MQSYFQIYNQTHIGEVRELDIDPLKNIKNQLNDRNDELLQKVNEKRQDLALKYFRNLNKADHAKSKAMDDVLKYKNFMQANPNKQDVVGGDEDPEEPQQ